MHYLVTLPKLLKIMAMACSSSSFRDCALFTPAPVKVVCCRSSNPEKVLPFLSDLHIGPSGTSDHSHSLCYFPTSFIFACWCGGTFWSDLIKGLCWPLPPQGESSALKVSLLFRAFAAILQKAFPVSEECSIGVSFHVSNSLIEQLRHRLFNNIAYVGLGIINCVLIFFAFLLL